MGTKMAPSYANLLTGVLEDRMMNSYVYKPLVHLRYIDKISMIWTEGEENLMASYLTVTPYEFLIHLKCI